MQRSYKFAGLATVTAIVSALLVQGCGAGLLTDDISDVAPSTATCNSATYPDTMGYSTRLKKYSNDPQCSTQVQAAESHRQAAIANCSAGNKVNADTNYSNYKKSVTVVNSYCP
jgi:hypothetical protein